MSDDLLPCPHCGGIAKIAGTKVDFPTHKSEGWRIWCDTPCCAMGMNTSTREKCIAAWNTRADVKPNAKVHALIAAAKEMLTYANRNGDSMAQFLAKPLAEALAALEQP